MNVEAISGGEVVKLRRACHGPRMGIGTSWRDTASNRKAFTLLELLVVIGIIGLLSAIGLPALKGIGGSTDLNTATRQLMDDLSFARLKAINSRSTVYVVFVTPKIVKERWTGDALKEVQKLANGQYTMYALFAKRRLGDQPGPGTANYLTEWRTLPPGTFVSTNKFQDLAILRQSPLLELRPFPHFDIPFPTPTNASVRLPCIAFDYQGRLVFPPGEIPGDEFLTISKGSIIYPIDPQTQKYILAEAEVIETPKGNHTNNPMVRVDWLTGRARIDQRAKL